MADKEEEKPVKAKEKQLVVVQQFPTQQIEETETQEYITVDEALTEILKKVREIHKSVA